MNNGQPVKRESCLLAFTSFITASNPHNKCGSDGLPLTPKSTIALGYGLELCSIKHKNICPYIDFKCGKDGRIFAVSQFFTTSLTDYIERRVKLSEDRAGSVCLFLAKSIFEGLEHLNSKKLTHQGLCPSKVLVDCNGTPKLLNFGMHHITDSTKLIDFPLSEPKYSSPIKILQEHTSQTETKFYNPDVWATCLIILEVFHGQYLSFGSSIEETFHNILGLCQLESSSEVLNQVITFFPNKVRPFDENNLIENSLKQVLESGLVIDPKQQNTAKSMLYLLKSIELPLDSVQMQYNTNVLENEELNGLDDMDCKRAWHLWNLAGGDVSNVYSLQAGNKTAPINRLPCYMAKNGGLHGQESTPEALYDPKPTVLPLETLKNRLKVTPENLNRIYPLLLEEFEQQEMVETSKLPLLIKENDFDYQVYRMALCKQVLESYPYKKDILWKTSKIDIPPAYRGELWSKLLDVKGNEEVEEFYCDIDKETPIKADHQLSVDIPRCHSYNKIMSSPAAHRKLKRVLKAWLNTHPELTYWQGFDSLCAVFLHCNFNHEARAYFSICKFIKKYMHGLFRKNNSDVLQEYLAVFFLLLSFHDPHLYLHLKSTDPPFEPNLFAVPWFLTMFAHVFPLHSIVHLWDTLLLGNASFPLCVGVAILTELRSHLLHADFNECILFFSELPQIDIGSVMEKSINLFCQTPKSATHRKHSPELQRPQAEKLRASLPKVEELKAMHCCQISGEELIDLCGLKNYQKSSGRLKSTILVIDIRPKGDFQRGAVPESHNVPWKENVKVPANVLQQKKWSLVVVVGRGGEEDQMFGRMLLEGGLQKVCVLRGGIESLKLVGVLIVPS